MKLPLLLAVALATAASFATAGSAAATNDVYCAGAPSDQSLVQSAADGGGTVTLHGHCLVNLDLTTDVALVGAPGTILDGNAAGSVVTVEPYVTATLSGFRVENGLSSAGGGIAGYFRSHVTVSDSTVADNVATDRGGGILASYGYMALDGVTVDHDRAFTGGGIQAEGCLLTITDLSITGNSAAAGGGLYSDFSVVSVTTTHVFANSAAVEGGGIDQIDGNGFAFTVTASRIDHNSAGSIGGGIHNEAFEVDTGMTLVGSTVAFNSSGQGGGIYNTAEYQFGFPFGPVAKVDLSDSTIAGNSARSDRGGGIINLGGGAHDAVVTLTNSTIAPLPGSLNGNTARYGGGVYNGGSGADLKLNGGARISGNVATIDGGGVDNAGGHVLVAGGLVILNRPDNCVGC